MGIGVQGCFLYSRQQLTKAWVAREVGTQYQGVGEEAEQSLQLCALPPGYGHAHRDIFLPAVAIEQHLKDCDKLHEQCRTFVPTKLLEFGTQRHRQIINKIGPAMTGYWRTWPVGGKIQLAHACELSPPVIQLGVKRLTLQRLALPRCVISILKRQHRQTRFQSPDQGAVNLGKFAFEDAGGPAVVNDMMSNAQEHVLLATKAHQQNAPWGPGFQVKRFLHLAQQQSSQRIILLTRGNLAKVGTFDFDSKVFVYDLPR